MRSSSTRRCRSTPSCSSPRPTTRTSARRFLKKHAGQLRTHVDQLAKKEYWRQFERSPEFVVAFIPGEPLLAAACEADPGLQDHALGKGIVLATPEHPGGGAADHRPVLATGDAGRERTRGPAARSRALRAVAHHDRAHAVAAAQPHLERRGLQQGRRLLRVTGARHRPQVPRPRRRGDAVRRDRRARSDREGAPPPADLSARSARRRGRAADHRGAARGRRQHRHPA